MRQGFQPLPDRGDRAISQKQIILVQLFKYLAAKVATNGDREIELCYRESGSKTPSFKDGFAKIYMVTDPPGFKILRNK